MRESNRLADPSIPPAVPTANELLTRIDAMPGRPVLLVADLVADRFLSGSPKRISREAPVLILRYEGERLLPGGGANAAANVAALGGEPLTLGVVGDDASGRALLGEFATRGINASGILIRPGFQTPTKTRILAGFAGGRKQQVVRFDQEQERELEARERALLLAAAARFAARTRVAVLSDYGYGAVEPGLVEPLRRLLPPDSTILCDSRFRLSEFRGLDGATPNEEEAVALAGTDLEEQGGSLVRGGMILRSRLGARFLLITRGSRGMALFDEGGVAHVPVHGTEEVADVTGAGDTVIGTFALALAAGASALEAALLADYAGGIVVMKSGTATLSLAELRAAVIADPRPREELRWARS